MSDETSVVCDPCLHTMVPRCPGCGTEMYGPAVWAFSHGLVSCSCGHKVSPIERPAPPLKQRITCTICGDRAERDTVRQLIEWDKAHVCPTPPPGE